jgi:excisionase family DNA binding protein
MRCEICGCTQRRWLRVTTVARQFGASDKRVRRMIKEGTLSGVRFGGQWRVDHESLDEYVCRDSVRFVPRGAEGE